MVGWQQDPQFESLKLFQSYVKKSRPKEHKGKNQTQWHTPVCSIQVGKAQDSKNSELQASYGHQVWRCLWWGEPQDSQKIYTHTKTCSIWNLMWLCVSGSMNTKGYQEYNIFECLEVIYKMSMNPSFCVTFISFFATDHRAAEGDYKAIKPHLIQNLINKLLLLSKNKFNPFPQFHRQHHICSALKHQFWGLER